MLDFALGILLAALLVRGWSRGAVKEVIGLAGLLLGTWFAFLLAPALGDLLARRFGMTPEVARIAAGVALFLLFGTALSVAGLMLGRVMRLPGLSAANRVGGAALAFAWGIALLCVVINVARVLPLPVGVGAAMDESVVVGAIAGPDALPQRVFHRVAGDTALLALQSIQSLFGTSRVVPGSDEVVPIPSARADEVRQVRSEADMVLEEINRTRAGEGLGALAPSDGLRGLAETRAAGSYQSGNLFRVTDCVATARQEAGLGLEACTDVVALAGTSLGALDGILADSEGRAPLTNPGFDRTGVAVVDGPTGRILVVVLGG
jgi:uncharacterized protein YkwD